MRSKTLTLALLALAAAATTGYATADSSLRNRETADTGGAMTKSIDIPAQPLAQALKQFANQTGLQLAVETSIANGHTSPAVKGQLSFEEALEKLLKGSGLRYDFLDSRTVAVSPASKTTASRDFQKTALRLAQSEPQTADSTGAAQVAQASAAASATTESQSNKDELQEIVVTGTRVQRAGFVAPTPTTVLEAADLQVAGRTNIGEVLADLPTALGSTTPTTTGTQEFAGTNYADLRGLGASRTLVLVDGRRPVPRSSDANIDLNTVPMGLIDRMEIVTGGASAAYGSDAVSGVVNIIMANKRDGLRMSAQYGDAERGDGKEYKVDFSYGFSFNEDRGHVILGANYNDANAIGPRTTNPSYRYGFIRNPAFSPTNGQPAQLLVPNVFFNSASLGGLILGCNPSCGNSSLQDLTFEPGGSSRPFVYGQYRGGPVMSGGDVQATNFDEYGNLKAPVRRGNAFARFVYDLSDNLRLKFDALYADIKSDSTMFPNDNGFFNPPLNIKIDNAFLPTDIRNAMQAAGIQSIDLGRINGDWGSTHNINATKNSQATLGLEGKFGSGWSWDFFYSHGESKVDQRDANQPIIPLLANSLDSIIGPGGQPVCRSGAAGCVPVNVFGYGASSAAALAYFMGTASYDSTITQNEAAATLRGEPFSSWAGPVSIAVGGEWRRQAITLTGDPTSAAKEFQGLNYDSLQGSTRVTEGFFEAVVPLLRDVPLFKALDFDGAIRVSDYERIGQLTSWKLGLSNDFNEQLRLRLTRSRDIRAPNLGELFQTGIQQLGVVVDPTDNSQDSALTVVGGNPNLGAEHATSTTVGFVYRPVWVRNLDLSVDYYKIDITDAITQLDGQDIVDRCANGATDLCGLITRVNGQITTIQASYINLSELQEKGVDFEAAHSLDLGTLSPSLRGRLRSRALVTYVDTMTENDGVNIVEKAGLVGGTRLLAGLPHWRGNLDERYELNNVAVDLRARYVGGGIRSRSTPIDQNHVAAQIYFDLGLEYRTSNENNVVVFGNVVNLLDRASPLAPNSQLYDIVGRSFNLGVRMKF